MRRLTILTTTLALGAAALLCAAPDSAAQGTPSPVQAPLILNLDAALTLAGENNPDIKKALESRNSNEGRYLEARAAAFPQISATGLYDRAWDNSEKGLDQPTDSGVGSAGVSVNQALYTWGRIPAAIRAASLGLELWKDEVAVARQAVTRDVTVAFYDVLLAREVLDIAVRNLEQKERHLAEAKKKYDAGTATDFDVLAAEVAVQNARPDVIRATSLIALSRQRLGFTLGLEGREVDADGTLETVAAEAPPQYPPAVATAIGRRPELALLRRQIGMNGELVRIYAAGDKPTLALQTDTGWKSVTAGGAEGDGLNASAGIVLSWPFFDGGRTRGRVAQAESDLASLRLDEERLRDSIALQVRAAIDEVKGATETMTAISGTARLAERLLAMAEKGFDYGVKTRLEVDDASVNLRAARVNLAQARRNYAAARANLAWAMGGP